MRRSDIALLTFALVLLAARAADAQFDTASVVGTVKDSAGAVVPGATVTLTNADTNIAVTRVTDDHGNFEFMTVRVGRYKVTAELQGFSVAVADDIQITVGARQRVDLQLTPGSLTETVQVLGASPMLETD
ncbi:MAG: carboxypeptidase-like regulatory domain-containing protein, partial [Vicinamibacterales bacterium]